jgi:predicted glutamine amidotransferase
MAWSGQPTLIEDLLFKPKHSLIDQSLHAQMGAETTNGDGFGLGWYAVGPRAGVYRSIEPAWGDAGLRELSQHIVSPLFMTHVRATSGTVVSEPLVDLPGAWHELAESSAIVIRGGRAERGDFHPRHERETRPGWADVGSPK